MELHALLKQIDATREWINNKRPLAQKDFCRMFHLKPDLIIRGVAE